MERTINNPSVCLDSVKWSDKWLAKIGQGLSHLSHGVAWLLGLIWVFPLLYAFWAAFHGADYVAHFDLFAPVTLDNFVKAWAQAPFVRYMINTIAIAVLILAGQLIICTLAAYALARISFTGRAWVFALIIMQLMVTPEI